MMTTIVATVLGDTKKKNVKVILEVPSVKSTRILKESVRDWLNIVVTMTIETIRVHKTLTDMTITGEMTSITGMIRVILAIIVEMFQDTMLGKI